MLVLKFLWYKADPRIFKSVILEASFKDEMLNSTKEYFIGSFQICAALHQTYVKKAASLKGVVFKSHNTLSGHTMSNTIQ